MPPAGFRLRPATPRDTTIVAELMAACFATYGDFAPHGWRPRTAIQEEPEIHMRLNRGDVHGRLALAADGRAAGFAGWMPATIRGAPHERIPDRAHLWTLFVAPAWWGTGLAADLLGWAVEGMRGSGYAGAQLWTPDAHARARRFYEREGWGASERRELSSELGLDLVMYERTLS